MQEKILNFDNLLKNVHLKISGNQETEKVLTKIEEKAINKNRRKGKGRSLCSL